MKILARKKEKVRKIYYFANAIMLHQGLHKKQGKFGKIYDQMNKNLI